MRWQTDANRLNTAQAFSQSLNRWNGKAVAGAKISLEPPGTQGRASGSATSQLELSLPMCAVVCDCSTATNETVTGSGREARRQACGLTCEGDHS